MLNIVLVEPEIPQNTGNIARTCACTNTRLHLVRPFGFEISDKTLRRAGLDYWDKVEIFYYDSLDEFFEKNGEQKYFYATTKASKSYTDETFPDGSFILFGKETKGLPESLIFAKPERAVRIPMFGSLRSLNLSNSVAIILYEALRQNDFFGQK
ncbi:MAG: tRNA (uridine(34)/cytosine(34)/5-carboxymethylaminomethyluridine(34)-2'-O)-methyltransferase TrmL [Clostridia bacterium]|nr:tRNA (uridine(34)/cytosine(34)/5-carboxymethylaminomethyluridine(34)-2'-O)-methyltransferase TrmL [Clostridia bacterium]